MTNAEPNTRRIEYRELYKTIRKMMDEDIKKYNEGVVESAIENRNSLSKAKRKLMLDKKQLIALTEDNIRTRNRKKIIEIIKKFYSDL